MGLFEIIALLLTIAALFSFINYRFLKLPPTIGLMLIGLLSSLLLVMVGSFAPHIHGWALGFLGNLRFDKLLLHGMLSFLLFAGALHVNINDLKKQYRIITVLASAGVLISTFLVGTGAWFIFGWLGFEINYIYCLLFGALIAPTDPVAVMGILKTAGVPKSLETKIVGESLFNDGVGVVVFLVLLEIATGDHMLAAADVMALFLGTSLALRLSMYSAKVILQYSIWM